MKQHQKRKNDSLTRHKSNFFPLTFSLVLLNASTVLQNERMQRNETNKKKKV